MAPFSRFAKGILLPLLALCFFAGCGPFQRSAEISEPSTGTPGAQGNQPEPPSNTGDQPLVTPPVAAMKVAPLWEAARDKDGKSWTDFSSSLILAEGGSLLKGTADMASFCPTYAHLDTAGKVNVWVYLISAVVKYESGFNPLSRLKENLGTDSITHLPVYSEGLMQLSYQDSHTYTFCNEFNWNTDKNLSPVDPKKTILDPYKNLRCGIRILNKLVGKHNLIAYDSGNYWSTLMPSHSPEHSIQALVNKMSICKL